MPPPENSGLIFIAHGHGNNPSHWPARLIKRIRSSEAHPGDWDIYAHDWEEHASRVLTAARSGDQIGRDLARGYLDSGDRYVVIHLIGQSMGAYLAQGFIDEYRKLGGGAAIHVTFLDPFLLRGVLGFGYGVRRFGRGADFAENYYVSRDPVPATNRPLRHAHNTDISALVPDSMRESFNGAHWWVVEFYRQSVGRSGPGFSRSPAARDLFGGRSVSGGADPGSPDHEAIKAEIAGLGDQFPPGERTRLRP